MNCISIPLYNNSDLNLYSGFVHNNWNKMTASDRLALLQAVADKQANGRYAVNVSFKDMDCHTSGYQTGNNIYLNRDMFVNDKISYDYNNKLIEYSLQDSNWQALETVLHEERHIYQDMVSNGVIKATTELKETFDANGFTVTDIDGQRGSQYMLGENNYAMYYLNPTELDAYKTSQDKTEQIIAMLKNNDLNDPSADLYLNKLENNGYKAQLSKFIQDYDNTNIDKEVEQILKNTYYGTNIAVDKKIENEVKKEMIESQKIIDSEDLKEARTMSKQIFNENGFTYTVDKNGTITANGKVEADNGVKCGTRTTPDGMKYGDQRGHIIAAREGGVNKNFNMTAQDGKLNQGAYKTAEKAEIDLAKQGYDVQTSKTAFVSNQLGGRPDAYMVNDTISLDGKTQDVHMSFQNMSPQEQQDMNEQSAEAFAQMSSEFSNPDSRPEGMTENEYADLMKETDMSLPSVKDEFDMENTTSMSFDEGFVADAQSSFDSETGAGVDNGESGIGMDSGTSSDTCADGGTDGGIE